MITAIKVLAWFWLTECVLAPMIVWTGHGLWTAWITRRWQECRACGEWHPVDGGGRS